MQTISQNGQSQNPQEQVLDLLKQQVPEIFSDGKIDVQKLKNTLGEETIASEERYGLNWSGKTECFKKIQAGTTNTLKPKIGEGVDEENTNNIFIEGDNFEALKVIQKAYYGQVKCIYIDPPYNTGNDFVYNDKFAQNKKEYLQEIGAIDADGNVINAGLYSQNTKDGGHFHSNWLNMMYPRLFLARNMLRQDGVIFVSIDDNEVHNLRMVMDEIFGEENFVESFIWRSRLGKGSTSEKTATLHEYILCYARKTENLNILGDIRIKEKDTKERLRQWGQGDRKEDRPSMFFPILHDEYGEIYPIKPDRTSGRWRASKEKVQDLMRNDLLIFEKQEDGRIEVYRKILAGSTTETAQDSILLSDLVKTTAHGSKEIGSFFDTKIFSYPKPTTLIRHFIEIVTGGDDIILDFFSGSGTTAHAVMQLNAEDGGKRQWVSVQLPEKCKEGTEAQKAGFVNIAEIAKERIRRAGQKIQEDKVNCRARENALGQNPEKEIDTGFKVFKVDQTNFKIWNTQIKNVEQLQTQLLDFVDNVRAGATEEGLLIELLLKSGVMLNEKITIHEKDGEKFYEVPETGLVFCFVKTLTEPLFQSILDTKPAKIILLDTSFNDHDEFKTNMLLKAEQAGITEVRVI